MILPACLRVESSGDEGRIDRLHKLGLTGNRIQLDITPLIPRQMRDILRKLLLIWISGLAVFAGRLD